MSLLASGKVPLIVSKYLAGGNLMTLNKQKEDSAYDITPIAVGEEEKQGNKVRYVKVRFGRILQL